jgi:subtilisin family serine protease
MRISRLVLAVSAMLLVAAPAPSARGAGPEDPTAAPGRPYFAGQLVVRFRPTTGAGERRRLRARGGARLRRALALPGLELLELEPGRSVRAAQAAFESSPAVLYAEPNFRLTPDAVPNDPLWRDQWDMHRIGADRAWDLSPASRDVVVAVFDSGVEIRHPDLRDNVWTNAGETGAGREDNGVDDDGNGYVDDWQGWSFDGATGPDGHSDPTDYGGHGTNVAGIIGAVGDNGIGLAGVSPRVRIMAFAVWGAGTAGVADAIAYADAQGVRVANGSFGIPRSQAIEDALAAAPGLLLSVSAGNEAWDVEQHQDERYPCVSELPNVICVAATDRGDSMAGFSNWGAVSVDLAAPGDDMPSLGLPRHVLMLDEFESDLAGRWTTGGTGRAWGRSGASPEWPQQWTTWLLDSPGAEYDNDTDSWIETAEPVSLVDHEDCWLRYWLHRDLAPGDALKVEASSGGGPWVELSEHTGTENFAVGEHPLTAYEDRPGLKVRFRLVSDGAGQAAGVALDNVRVWCRVPPFRGDEYPHVGGTSNAAPHVAGTAALLVAQRPWLTTAQLRAAILESVAPQPSLAGRTVTGGRLDTLRALGGTWPVAADPPAPPGDAPPGEQPLPLPPPMARDARAPRCSPRAAPRARPERRRVRVVAVCDEAARLSATLAIAGTVAGRARGAVSGPGRRVLSIALSRRSLRGLRRARTRRAVLRLTAADAAGNRRTVRRGLTLRR